MKAKILSIEGTEKKEIELPEQFDSEYRPDLIQRAVLAIQSHKKQPYGAKLKAGLRPAARLSRRRRQYRGSYGKGISRVPRKIMSRRGLHFNWVGAVVAGAVGGIRAHPPKAEKVLELKINAKERKKALCSAIAATANKDIVKERGHMFTKEIPLIIEDSIEKLSKTKDVVKAFELMGIGADLERASVRKLRAGTGRMRGRKYKKRKGPLVVVSQKCPLMRISKSLPGVDIVEVKSLNAELLAPGAMAGRLTAWTAGAIEKMGKEKLFI